MTFCWIGMDIFWNQTVIQPSIFHENLMMKDCDTNIIGFIPIEHVDLVFKLKDLHVLYDRKVWVCTLRVPACKNQTNS